MFGSARTPVEHPVYALARKLGEELARYDLMVITGAGGASWLPPTKAPGWRTAWASTSPCPSSSTPTIRWTAAATCCRSFFFLRKLFFVEADALVLCPGGFGTPSTRRWKC